MQNLSSFDANPSLFKAMFEDATLGILAVDKSGIIRHVNAFAAQLFGYEQQELTGQQLEILLPEKWRDTHVKHRDSYHKKPTPREMGASFLDLYGRKKNGAQFPVKISLSYVKFGDDQLAIAFVSDDSLQKNYAKHLI